jgi:small subunit ribosomal protein S6e
MAMKLVIGDPKTGKTKQLEVEDEGDLLGKEIGDKITVDMPELAGYELQITGGSDASGFPMRFDVDIPKKKILAVQGIGLKRVAAGRRKRKMVAGKMVTGATAQLNLKIIKAGKQSIFEEPKVEEAPKEVAKPEEAPAEAPAKEEPKAEEKKEEAKPEEKKAEAPAKDTNDSSKEEEKKE